jgi:hypothetical protein
MRAMTQWALYTVELIMQIKVVSLRRVSWNNVVRNVLSAGRPALVSLEEVQQAVLAFQASEPRLASV